MSKRQQHDESISRLAHLTLVGGVVGALLVLATYAINLWMTSLNWNGATDYVAMFNSALSQYGWQFLLGERSILRPGEVVSFGSAAYLRYIPLAFAAFFAIMIARSLVGYYAGRPRSEWFWYSLPWVSFGIVWFVATMDVAAFAHYLDLYTIRVAMLPDGSFVKIAGIEGSIDTITHTLSPNLLTIMLLSVNIMRLLRLSGRRGRLIEALIVILLVITEMAIWEVGESGNPTQYANPPWNSIGDFVHGTFGMLTCIGAYNLLVPFEDEP